MATEENAAPSKGKTVRQLQVCCSDVYDLNAVLAALVRLAPKSAITRTQYELMADALRLLPGGMSLG